MGNVVEFRNKFVVTGVVAFVGVLVLGTVYVSRKVKVPTATARTAHNDEKVSGTADETARPAIKPSPAVPIGAKTPSQSNVSHAAPTTSNSVTNLSSPSPWPPDGMQLTAHHKGRGGCDGKLTLKASGLEFVCPGNDHGSFSVALTEIRARDKDGIVTKGGAKYHFDKIPGGGKEYVEQLFEQWLRRARLTN